MNKQKHLSIQNFGEEWGQTPFGVIISALAECDSQEFSLYDKALHIDNALAVFVRSGYKIKFSSLEDVMLIFEKPTK